MMPRSRARRMSSATGRTTAVVEVTWLRKRTLVRSLTPDHTASTIPSAEANRERQRPAHVTRAALLADERPGPVEGAVLVVGREQLVARLDAEGTGADVEAGGGVGH